MRTPAGGLPLIAPTAAAGRPGLTLRAEDALSAMAGGVDAAERPRHAGPADQGGLCPPALLRRPRREACQTCLTGDTLALMPEEEAP